MTKAELESVRATIRAMIQEQLVAMARFAAENTRHGITMATGCRTTAEELKLQLAALGGIEATDGV